MIQSNCLISSGLAQFCRVGDKEKAPINEPLADFATANIALFF